MDYKPVGHFFPKRGRGRGGRGVARGDGNARGRTININLNVGPGTPDLMANLNLNQVYDDHWGAVSDAGRPSRGSQSMFDLSSGASSQPCGRYADAPPSYDDTFGYSNAVPRRGRASEGPRKGPNNDPNRSTDRGQSSRGYNYRGNPLHFNSDSFEEDHRILGVEPAMHDYRPSVRAGIGYNSGENVQHDPFHHAHLGHPPFRHQSRGGSRGGRASFGFSDNGNSQKERTIGGKGRDRGPTYQGCVKPKGSAPPYLDAKTLVNCLSRRNGQWSHVHNLGNELHRDIRSLIDVAKSRDDIFKVLLDDKIEMTVIELVPRLGLCQQYLGAGCLQKGQCCNIHLCKFFIAETCRKRDCNYGHDLKTDHNMAVLSHLLLDDVSARNLHNVLQKICDVSPQICQFYNRDKGCIRSCCSALHICSSAVYSGGNCPRKGQCSLNHNIKENSCQILLTRYGISMNNSPRDIMLRLARDNTDGDDRSDNESDTASVTSNVSRSAANNCFDDFVMIENPNYTGEGRGTQRKHNKTAAACMDDDGGLPAKENIKKNKHAKNEKKTVDVQHVNPDIQLATKNKGNFNKISNSVWSSDLIGDVKEAEICNKSITGSCNFETSGCKYLHSKNHFCWQVQSDGNWFNLLHFHSLHLEKNFCDVHRESTDLYALDPQKFRDNGIVRILGADKWKVNFLEMKITDVHLTSKQLRRLGTKSSVQCKPNEQEGTVFVWYFADDNNKWIEYGRVDSADNKAMLPDVTSVDIEKAYLTFVVSGEANNALNFTNRKFNYSLDFQSMKQLNLDTGKSRRVRRRPKFVSKSSASVQYAASSEAELFTVSEVPLPRCWDQMGPTEVFRCVTLLNPTAEYLQQKALVQLTIPNANIVRIDRVQNPFLWRPFVLSREKKPGEIKKLFKAVEKKDIHFICENNVDERITGFQHSDYGKGTYFFQSASGACRAHENVRNDASTSSKTLILTQVLIGDICQGVPDMRRPPKNNSKNDERFDTSVDVLKSPNVFVKYAKDQYYPEFVIELA